MVNQNTFFFFFLGVILKDILICDNPGAFENPSTFAVSSLAEGFNGVRGFNF